MKINRGMNEESGRSYINYFMGVLDVKLELKIPLQL